MTAQTKERRPGGRPRRRPHRKYGYSDDSRKIEGAVVAMCFVPIVIAMLMGVGM